MARASEPTIAGWGRVGVPGHERLTEDLEGASKAAVLFRGLGRSYGDSALPPPSLREVIATPRADRILSFDETTGRLRAEAGLSLAELLRVFMPRGWFVASSPGTKHVTLGGMVASDVHGKSHHVNGTIGRYIHRLRMRVGDGRIVECSRAVHPDLFRATLGGMGLTGHILEVELDLMRIPSPWIWCETERVPDIETYLAKLKEAAGVWPMTMGWIDCLKRGRHMGRGVLYRGRWATPEEAPRRFPAFKERLTVPFTFPSWVLNNWSIRAFNFGVYWKALFAKRAGIAHPDAFWYPLDAIRHWDRIYGKRGFTQHQCVLPEERGPGAARRVLEVLTRLGGASFLCVIKDCGPEGEGLLSFPRPGISIALDIPMRHDTQALIDALNEAVIAEGGRIYLAKDQLTRPGHFRRMEPRLDAWQRVRAEWDPERRIRSAQSVRLFGDPA